MNRNELHLYNTFQHDLNLYQDKAILMNIEFRQSMFYFLIQQHGLNKFYTAFITMLIPVIKSDFLQINFMGKSPSNFV